MLSLSLDDSRITRSECLGRTWWSSSLDLATYLYYFTSGCVPIITRSHDLPEYSMIIWLCHMIWLPNPPCYLYLDLIIWLDIRDQIFEYIGNSFLSGALITHYLYNYYMVCALFFYAYHVTSCDMMLWLPVMWPWLCDTCDVILSYTSFYVVSPR